MTGRIELRKFLNGKRDGKTRSQVWLSGKLGISETYVSMILNGSRRPSLNVAAEIETLTGIPASSFAEAA